VLREAVWSQPQRSVAWSRLYYLIVIPSGRVRLWEKTSRRLHVPADDPSTFSNKSHDNPNHRPRPLPQHLDRKSLDGPRKVCRRCRNSPGGSHGIAQGLIVPSAGFAASGGLWPSCVFGCCVVVDGVA